MESLECDFSKQYVKYTQLHRSKLFYNQWRWAVSWSQSEIAVLRYTLDADRVVEALEARKRWDKSIVPVGIKAITPETERKVHFVRQWLVHNCQHVKTVFNSGVITLYVNDPILLNDLIEIGATMTPHRNVYVRESMITFPPNTVCMKRDYGYSFRSYFRAQELSDNSIKVLNDWIANMGDSVKACPSLKAYLQGRRRSWWARNNWTWDHYFVDHNDTKLDVWMSMMCPGIVRKTLSIVSIAK